VEITKKKSTDWQEDGKSVSGKENVFPSSIQGGGKKGGREEDKELNKNRRILTEVKKNPRTKA